MILWGWDIPGRGCRYTVVRCRYTNRTSEGAGKVENMANGGRLIEEVAVAIYGHNPEQQSWDGEPMSLAEAGDSHRANLARRQAEAAVGVFDKAHIETMFEKAHTPNGGDWYDTHCPTCDAPEPWHTATCAVVHVKVGEPSDAQVEASCREFYEDARGLASWDRLVSADPDVADDYRRGMRSALVVAGVVR